MCRALIHKILQGPSNLCKNTQSRFDRATYGPIKLRRNPLNPQRYHLHRSSATFSAVPSGADALLPLPTTAVDIMASITPLITTHVMNGFALANVGASQQSKSSQICISISGRPDQGGWWCMKGSCSSTGSNVFLPRISMTLPWEYQDNQTQSTGYLFPHHSRMGAVSFVPQAGKGHFSHYSNDPVRMVEKKPRWWWRFLACIYYLRPLHETWWLYAEPAYHLHPVLEDLEFLTVPFRVVYWFHFVAYLLTATRLVR